MASDSPFKSTRSRTRVQILNNQSVESPQRSILRPESMNSPSSVLNDTPISNLVSPSNSDIVSQNSLNSLMPLLNKINSSASIRDESQSSSKRLVNHSSSSIPAENANGEQKKLRRDESVPMDSQLTTGKERHDTVSLSNDALSDNCKFIANDSRTF